MAKYWIKRNNHYCNFSFWRTLTTPRSEWFTTRNRVGFTCTFAVSCLYDFDAIERYDINKLYGFATTYNHHNQSARIGWRTLDGKTIEILTYTYNQGVRDTTDTVLGVVVPGESFYCSILDKETHYVYTFIKDSETVTAWKEKSPDKVLFKYILKPFFGGNRPAPHDMHLTLVLD